MKTKFFTLFLSFILILSLSSCRNYTFKSGSSKPNDTTNTEPETPSTNTQTKPTEDEELILDYEIGEWKIQNSFYADSKHHVEIIAPVTNKSNFDLQLCIDNVNLIINENIMTESLPTLYTSPSILSPNEKGYILYMYDIYGGDIYQDQLTNLDPIEDYEEWWKICNKFNENTVQSVTIDTSNMYIQTEIIEKVYLDPTIYTIQFKETLYGYHEIEYEPGKYLSKMFPGCEFEVNVTESIDKKYCISILIYTDNFIRTVSMRRDYTYKNGLHTHIIEPSYRTKYEDVVKFEYQIFYTKNINK